jgi:hypothetical protein
MGLFGKLVGLGVNIVTTPVAIVKDVVSLGGSIDNNGKSHTLEHLEKIAEDANKD